MIRSIFVSLIFFFGPVILMFVLRRLLILLRLWMLMRKKSHDDMIDITPHHEPVPPSVWFVAAAILMGITFAVLAWQNIRQVPEGEGIYTPAYLDEQGRVIEGKIKPASPPEEASKLK